MVNKNSPMYGKSHSKETKEKMKQSKIKIIAKGWKPKASWKKGHTPWNKGIKQWQNKIPPRSGKKHTEETIEIIREKATRRESKIKGRKFTKEHIDKLIKTRIEKGIFSKEKNPNWKGGITKLQKSIRASNKYNEWRLSIFKRDNYKCQKCNLNKNKLNVHHIKSFKDIILNYNIKTFKDAVICKELWDVDNGKTLCLDCHKQTDNFLKNGNYYK